MTAHRPNARVPQVARLLGVVFIGWLLGLPSYAAALVPSIEHIAPNNGAAAGGTTVIITGTGFSTGSTVGFSSKQATSVTVESSTKIKAVSPAGSGLVGIAVTGSEGTSAATPRDQFAYDALPNPLWLGLNGNGFYGGYGNEESHNRLGPLNQFFNQNIVWDREDFEAGMVPEAGNEMEKAMEAVINAGMIPDVALEFAGYTGEFHSSPDFPTEENHKLVPYAEGFAKSASAILKKYPNRDIAFEPMNEPWGYTTPQYSGKEYANVIVEVLNKSIAAGVPLDDIYVGATGWDCTATCTANDWVQAMYEAQPKLEKEIQGWYLHPYGEPTGVEEGDSRGIESLPLVQEKMTSGQNNIIASEVGYCDDEISGAECGSSGKTGVVGAQDMTEMLSHAKTYHEAGWLKALLVYSRGDRGWAMELPESKLTKEGEALDAFSKTLVGWAAEFTPTVEEPRRFEILEGVSCTSSTACTAVGHIGYFNVLHRVSSSVPLIERWNGMEWVLQAQPEFTQKQNVLASISCTTQTQCVVVGRTGSSNLAESWAGTEWIVRTVPSPTEAKESRLKGVSCGSSSMCIAVGSYENSSGKELPTAYSWNGTEWKAQTMPTIAGSVSSSLNGISCISTILCRAAGEYSNSSGEVLPYAGYWNGSVWVVERTPSPEGVKYSRLNGLSCTSTSACTAVGSSETSSQIERPLAERWSGSEWKIQPTPESGSTREGLSSVVCITSVSCIAVGTQNLSDEAYPVIEHWNGSKWSSESIANPALDEFLGIACSLESACVAIGTFASKTAFAAGNF